MVRMMPRQESAEGPFIRGLLALLFLSIAALDGLTLLDAPEPVTLLAGFQIFQGRPPRLWDWLLIGACLFLALFMTRLRLLPKEQENESGIPWWQHVPVKVWWWLGRIATCVAMAALALHQLSSFWDDLQQGYIDPPNYAAYIPVLGLAGLFMFLVMHEPTPRLRGATTLGSAGWADDRDILPLLHTAGAPLPPGGLLLAPRNRRTDIILPRRYADFHTLLLGPTGSGKTRDYLMLWAAQAQTSFVVSDPKGELWDHISGYQRETWRFAPRETNASRAFNWIPLCREEQVARQLAMALMQTNEDQHELHFWKFADLRMCAALFSHAAHQRVPTPATVHRLLHLSATALVDVLRTSPATSARAFANTLAEMKPEIQAGVVLSVADKLCFLDDPVIRRFTSASLTPPNFSELVEDATRPIGVYWILHERDVSLLQPLTNMFFTLLLEHLLRFKGDPEARVALLLDEFGNLGRIPDFTTTITVARDRGVQLMLGIQALSQLDGLYGESGARTIRTNCATKIVLHGLDEITGEEVSRALGETTVQHEVQTRTPESWTTNTYTYAEHHDQRRLLTSDEVRRIGRDEAIIIVSNFKPIRARRHHWSEPPLAAQAEPLGRELGMDPPEPGTRGAPRLPLPPKPGDELRFVRRHLPELDNDTA